MLWCISTDLYKIFSRNLARSQASSRQIEHYARTCGAKDTLAVLILATKRVLALGSTTVVVAVATLENIWGYRILVCTRMIA